MKPIIEVQLSEPSDKLTVEYHKAATELGRVIPLGHCHLLNIQWMLHSIYWYKSEAKFVEAWHVIGAAVREAHELGTCIHLDLYSVDINVVLKVFTELPLPKVYLNLSERCVAECGVSWIAGTGKRDYSNILELSNYVLISVQAICFWPGSADDYRP
jgi:hypothetical protein